MATKTPSWRWSGVTRQRWGPTSRGGRAGTWPRTCSARYGWPHSASRASYDRSFPNAGPWLFGVAHNTLRRHWRSRPAEEPYADVTGLASGWDPWTAVDHRVDVESVLRHALAQLRPQQREILTLVAWEDLTVADAGRVLGMPPGSARRSLHQARTALRNVPGLAALLTDLNTVKEPN